MGKIKLGEFYSDLVANWLSGGDLINRVNLSSIGIKPMFDRIVTKKDIKKVICITRFPVNYDSSISGVLNDIAFSIDSNCKIFTNSYSIPTKVDIRSRIFRKNMAQSEESYEKYKSMFESLSGTEQTLGKKIFTRGGSFTITKSQMEKLEQAYLSYKYIHSVTTNRGSFSNTIFFVEVVAHDNKVLNKIRKEITDYLDSENFGYSLLKSNSSNFLKSFAPASYLTEFPCKEFADNLMSDENITHTIPYITRGFIGDGTGELLGIDMGSKTPLIVNFFESGARQIVLLSAPSGHGKSFLAFSIALSFIASGKHVSVIDIKGDEWSRLANYCDTALIDISDNSRYYVNTMNLSDIFVENKDDAKELYSMAITATRELCLLIVQPEEKDKTICSGMLEQVITKLYSNNGVDPNAPRTFQYTRNMNYTQIIDGLDKLKSSPSYKQYGDLIDRMRISLESKFRTSNIFKGEEISIDKIISSPLVIYSLNKNKDSSHTMDDSIRTFMISYLDMKKISIRKSKKLGTVCFYEEMQRKKEFASLMDFIAGVVTGARSSNVVVFLLCNSIKSLVEDDMSAISSNLSSYILGPVEDQEDLKRYERLNCKDIIPMIKDMTEHIEDFRNQFIIKFDTGKTVGTTILKSHLPESYIKAFETRDVI